LDADKKIRVPVLLGPTAVGKSALALTVCEQLGFEVVSCDSRQVYRGMDIGTAKPSPHDRTRVKHWMIDVVDPNVRYSAFAYANAALALIRERAALGKRVMLCGGTGLYFQALSRGVGPQVAQDRALRETYAAMAHAHGRQKVFDELARLDPVTASESHASNLQRNIRALEVYHATGKPMSELKKLAVPPADISFDAIVFSIDREALYERINGRVDRMMENGLLEEFRSLLRKGYGEHSPGLLCVGYREFFAFERNDTSLRNAVDTIKQDTRNYAKRQITWFRHQVKGLEAVLDDGTCKTVTARVREFCGL
jgi:tRNA dimethylallyltransferase